MTRWFAIGFIAIFAILVIGCGTADAPTPEATATPQTVPEATATPQTVPEATATPMPSDEATESGARQGDTVSVHYTGRLEDGTVFDSSNDREPLEFTLGQGQLIPGFEQAVLGMEPGQTRTVNIPAEEAYGPHDPQLVFEVDRSDLPPDLDLQVGMQVQAGEPGGMTTVFTVVDMTDTTVSLDANHQLAGKDLTFDIEMVSINN